LDANFNISSLNLGIACSGTFCIPLSPFAVTTDPILGVRENNAIKFLFGSLPIELAHQTREIAPTAMVNGTPM